MADHLGPDLDQLLAQRSQRPCVHGLGQCLPPEKIADVGSRSKQLKTDLVIHKIVS